MDDRRCDFCRTPLVRKTFACGELEKPSQLKARKFCDRTCADMKRKPRHSPQHPWIRAGMAMRRKLDAGG